MADPSVFHDIREQIIHALLYEPRPESTRPHETMAGMAAMFACDEVAEILRDQARRYAKQGGHDAAHALYTEAERFATRPQPIPHTAWGAVG